MSRADKSWWAREGTVRWVRRVLVEAGLSRTHLAECIQIRAADKYEGRAGQFIWLWPTKNAELGRVPKLSPAQTEIAAAALSAQFTIIATYPALGMLCLEIPN